MRFSEGSVGQRILFAACVGLVALALLPGLWMVVAVVGEPVGGFITVQGTPRPVYPQTLTAREAGLENYRAVLAVNGQELTEETPWMGHRATSLSRVPGEENTARLLQPDGSITTVTIPVHRYTWRDAAAYPLPVMLVGLLIALTGFGAFLLRPYEPTSWALVAYGVCIGGVLLTIGPVSYTPWAPAQSPFFGAVQLFVDAYEIAARWFVPAATLHLGLAFPVTHRWLERRPRLPLLLYAIAAPLALWTVLLHPYERITPHRAVYLAIVITGAGLIVTGVVFLWGRCSVLAIASQRRLARQRARVLLAGTVLGFGPLVAMLAYHVVIRRIAVTPSPPIYVPLLAFPLTLAYMVVKQELFDTGVAARQVLAYGAAGTVAAVGMWAAGRVSPVLAALFLLPLLYVWPRFHARLTALLYPLRTQFPDLHRAITAELAAAGTRQAVLEILARAPARVCEATGGIAFLLPRNTGEEGEVAHDSGVVLDAADSIGDEPLVQMLVATRQPITRAAVSVDPQFAMIRRAALAYMDKLGMTVVLPILRDGNVIGGLGIGPQARSDVYDPAALDLLTQLTYEAVRALELVELRGRNLVTTVRSKAAVRSDDTEIIAPLQQRSEHRAPDGLASRYQITRLLGEGGYKQVFHAHDTRLDRDVALALIKHDVLDDAGRLRVQQEARALGRLGDHSHIVTLFDIGESMEQLYLVSEYLAGGTLMERLEAAPECRLTLDDALRIGLELCDALNHVHTHGFVHRDVKPGNVWFTASGVTKLGDFGLVLPEEQSRITQQGALVGTFAYMAPEQFRDEPVTAQADLYSLGVLLYELLTGSRPFTGSTAAALAQAHVAMPPPAPTTHVPTLPAPLNDLIMALLAKQPHLRPPGAVAVRDVLQGVLAAGADTTRGVRFTPLPILTPAWDVFVGRESEFATARRMLGEATSGRGKLLLLVGEPGIGKTRLATECAQAAEELGARVLWGRCYQGEGAPAFWPWVQVLREYVRLTDADRLRRELEGGAAHVAQLVSDVTAHLPEVEPAPELEADAGRFLLFDSVTRFLKNAAAAQPLALILDDLHWADPSSLQLLQFLVGELAHAPLFVLATYRDVEVDADHPLAAALGTVLREGVSTRVQLDGLSEAAVGSLIRAQQVSGMDARLAHTVYERTEGNPFFIKETLRHIEETGAGGATDVGIPAGVRDVIRLRLGRLSDPCRSLLTVAAVVGRNFDASEVEAAGDLEPKAIWETLEEAEHAGLIRKGVDRLRPWRFTHALIRETLYDDLGARRRADLHRRIGEAMERVYAADLDPHLAALAFHFSEGVLAGADADRAVTYSVRAAERAITQTAYDDAVAHYERALEAQRHQTPPDEAQQCRLWLGLGRAYVSAANPPAAIDALRHAVDLARKLALPEPFAQAAFALGVLRTTYAVLDEEVVQLVEEGLGFVEAQDSPERAMLLAQLSLCLSSAGREADRAQALSQEALTIARGQHHRLALLHALLSGVELARVTPEDRRTLAAEMAEVGEQIGNPNWAGLGLMRRATAQLELGNRAGFAADARALAALAERTPLARLRWNAAITRVVAALLDGRFDAAVQAVEEAREHGVQFREENAQQTHFTQLFLVHHVRGTLPTIAEYIHRAREASLYRYGPRIAMAGLHLAERRWNDAQAEWDALAAEEFADLPDDRVISLWLASLAELAVELGDTTRAARLYDMFAPYARLTVTMGGGSACLGAADYWRGLLAAALERWEDAEAHFETALELNTRLGAWPFLARTQYAYARLLLAHGQDADHERAVELLTEAAATAEHLDMPVLRREAHDQLVRIRGYTP